MLKYIQCTAAAVVCFFLVFNTYAQSSKVRSNKEILMTLEMNPDNRVVVKWVSQEGHQTSRYIIQRSKDNEVFFDIREIEVKPNPNIAEGQLQYAFTDSKILRGPEYYRVMEYEVDGKSYLYAALQVKPNSPVSIVRTGESSIVRVAVDGKDSLTALVSTETGLGIPCEFELSTDNNVILRPLYSLNGGNYLVKLRSATGEKQFKFSVKSDDLL
jgi:hypothetical protein